MTIAMPAPQSGLDVVDQAWKHDHVNYTGKYYKVEDLVLAAEAGMCRGPRPVNLRRRRSQKAAKKPDFAERNVTPT